MNLNNNNSNYNQLKENNIEIYNKYKQDYDKLILDCVDNIKICYHCKECKYCKLFEYICKLYASVIAPITILNKIILYNTLKDKNTLYKINLYKALYKNNNQNDIITYFNNIENYNLYFNNIYDMLYNSYK